MADRLRGHLCRTGQPPAGRPSVPRGISRSVDPDRHFRAARTVRTGPGCGSYDVDAATMHMERH